MKKILLIILMFFIQNAAFSELVFIEYNVNMENFWQKYGFENQKVQNVSRRIIHANNLKRAPIYLERKKVKAEIYCSIYSKTITMTQGVLPYLSNDDELAFMLAQELAFVQEAYDGIIKMASIKLNHKKYMLKADLRAVDYMVKAGFNPIAAIIAGNKLFAEPIWDWGFSYREPVGSKRLLAMYEYIYKKYPSYLTTNMANNAIFVDFTNQYKKEINAFIQKQKNKDTSL